MIISRWEDNRLLFWVFGCGCDLGPSSKTIHWARTKAMFGHEGTLKNSSNKSKGIVWIWGLDLHFKGYASDHKWTNTLTRTPPQHPPPPPPPPPPPRGPPPPPGNLATNSPNTIGSLDDANKDIYNQGQGTHFLNFSQSCTFCIPPKHSKKD